MMKKKTLIATAFVSLMSASVAFAAWGGPEKGMGFDGGFRGDKLMEHMDRTLTADQVRTLQEARLIFKDNTNLKVGDVKKTDTGFTVTIVTKDNSLVEEKTLAQNGMDQKRYSKMKQRMDKMKDSDGKRHRGDKDKGRHGKFGKFGGHKMMAQLDRELTTDQVRTLQEARLIYVNNPNIKIGDVKPTSTGYTATIVTRDNSLVEELTLAKNGMKQDRYDMIKQRMEQRANKTKDQGPSK